MTPTPASNRLKRMLLATSLLGLSAPALARAAPVLPTGGKVVSGTAAIGAAGAGGLTITQSSNKAIINWSGFSIGAGGKVQFDNGKGATLNRVTGGSVSAIHGLLEATGSVYVINPNGVIIGKTGVVNVGGTFVASTLDTSNASFLAGGALSFTGSSHAAVVNYGKIGALGGDVALTAARVSDSGEIDAANGDAGLLAGYKVVLTDASLDGGRFAVQVGGAATSATDSGLIQAADAELRAEGGNVYALAGDTAGVIRATGVKSGGGKVWLVADGGTLDLAGAITAQGANSAPGSVETSGAVVHIGDVAIDAHGGTWLLDPYNLTINSEAANIIESVLNAGTSVVEQTTAIATSGPGAVQTLGSGDISVDAPISWSTAAGLTLSAYRNVGVNAQITSAGAGAVTLYADNTGTGVGSVSFAPAGAVSTAGAVNIFYNPASNPAGSVVNSTSYTNPQSFASNVSGGGALTAYMLVNTVYDLQNMQNSLSGSYALGRDIDASVTVSWNSGAGFAPIGSGSSAFMGGLEGQDHSISGLTIDRPSGYYVGLFGFISGFFGKGDVSNVSLVEEQVTGSAYVGGLAGATQGSTNTGLYQQTFSNDHVSGSISGDGNVGGIVGYLDTTEVLQNSSNSVVSTTGLGAGGIAGFSHNAEIVESLSEGAISGSSQVGGLVGKAVDDYVVVGQTTFGYITQSYSTTSVTGTASGGYGEIGGLVGENDAGVNASYATGRVSITAGCGGGGSPCTIGGLIGTEYGSVSSSYFDNVTTGQTSGIGGDSSSQTGVMALTSAQFANAKNFSGFSFGGLGSGAVWVIVDTDGSLNGATGATRPILLSEYSTIITNAHQLQLAAIAPGADYTLAGNIDASGTSDPSEIWGPAGFVPIGSAAPGFSGIFNGGGHTISGLTIVSSGASDIGLFGAVAATGFIENVTLAGASVSGGSKVGVLAGYNSGAISGASGKGSVSGSTAVGGLVGYNSGMISGSSGKAAVSSPFATGSQLGGLVGMNSGQLTQDYATGAVTGNTQVGGLVGLNSGSGTLEMNYATGAVSGASGKTAAGSGAAIGGLVGDDQGVIQLSYATGTVAGYSQVGGLAGVTRSGANTRASYATGAVTGASGKNTPSGSGAMVGGLIGESTETAGIDQTYATGAVVGVSKVGGLIGRLDGSGVLERSYATGSVKAASQVGGLVGYNNNEIEDTYATGAVDGSSSSGGLVGLNDQNGSIMHSYAAGSAIFGLVGTNNGQGDGGLHQDVFDEGSTGATVGVGSGPSSGVTAIGGATGLDPRLASSYPGFDFSNIWTIDPGSSRPFLIETSQSPPPS